MLLACFSLGLEEVEQEWGGLQGTKSGPESNRRGRINRASSAAHHLYRAGAGMDDAGDPFVFEIASFDLPGRDRSVGAGPVELLALLSPAQAAGSRLNRGPPALSL